MKGLRTLFGLIALFTSIVFFGMYLVIYLEFILNLYGGSIGDLPYEVTPTLLIVPPVLFVTSILAMATRRSKVGAIITSIFFFASSGLGIYFEYVYFFPNPGVLFFLYFFAAVGLFFLLGGIFQRKKYRTKAEERAYKAQQRATPYGPYNPAPGYGQPVYQQPVYQQPYAQPQPPVYQQAPATPLYQAPANGWTCPSCGNVNDPNGRFCRTCGGMRPASYQAPTPVQPMPVVPPPVQPVIQPTPVAPTPVQPALVAPAPVQPEPVMPAPGPIIPEVIQETPASSSLMGSGETLTEAVPVSEPTPLMETPKEVEKPVEKKAEDGWTCKVCQTKNVTTSKFCKNCGSPKDVNK